MSIIPFLQTGMQGDPRRWKGKRPAPKFARVRGFDRKGNLGEPGPLLCRYGGTYYPVEFVEGKRTARGWLDVQSRVRLVGLEKARGEQP